MSSVSYGNKVEVEMPFMKKVAILLAVCAVVGTGLYFLIKAILSSSSSSSMLSSSSSPTPSFFPQSTPVVTMVPPRVPTTKPIKPCYFTGSSYDSPMTSETAPDNPIWELFAINIPPMKLLSIDMTDFLFNTHTKVAENNHGTYQNTKTGRKGKVIFTVRRDLDDCSYPDVIGAEFDNDPAHNFGPICFRSLIPDKTVRAHVVDLFNQTFAPKRFFNLVEYKPINVKLVQLTIAFSMNTNDTSQIYQGDVMFAQDGDCTNLKIVSELGNIVKIF